jgi:hypothetical protein
MLLDQFAAAFEGGSICRSPWYGDACIFARQPFCNCHGPKCLLLRNLILLNPLVIRDPAELLCPACLGTKLPLDAEHAAGELLAEPRVIILGPKHGVSSGTEPPN